MSLPDVSLRSIQNYFTLKGSRQDGLTGLKGRILRHVVVSKTTDALRAALGAFRQQLEAAAR